MEYLILTVAMSRNRKCKTYSRYNKALKGRYRHSLSGRVPDMLPVLPQYPSSNNHHHHNHDTPGLKKD